MATAGEYINGALRLIGQLAAGESPSAEMSAYGLTAFNQMLDSWSTERLSVFSTQDQSFTWAANTTSRTLGPTGNFVGERPIQVLDSTYFVVGTLSYGIELVNEDQYNAIALKSQTSTYPQVMWVNMTMPDVTCYVCPVPTSAIVMHFISVVALAQASTLATSVVVPPGYLKAFRFNLAIEIAAEYGIEPPPTVKRQAALAKRTIKRINDPGDLMGMPYALVSRRRNNFNIWSGLPL